MKHSFRSFLLTLVAFSTLASCRDTSKLPAPKLLGSVPLITPVLSADTAKQYINFSRARASNAALTNLSPATRPIFEFSFDLDNSRDIKVATVEVYKSFRRTGNPPTVGPRVLVGAYNSFPVTISFNSQDLLTGLQRLVIPTDGSAAYVLNLKAANPAASNLLIQRGDLIVFTFEYILEDGSRVILTPIINTKVSLTAGGPANTTVPVLAATTQINKPYAMEAVIRDPIK